MQLYGARSVVGGCGGWLAAEVAAALAAHAVGTALLWAVWPGSWGVAAEERGRGCTKLRGEAVIRVSLPESLPW